METEMKSALAELNARLAKAESERDTWRAAGRQENYLAACSMADALEMQIQQLQRAARYAAVQSTTTASTAAPADSPDPRAREAAEFCVSSKGGRFYYRGYRYDRFADAVNYARLDRARGFNEPGADNTAPLELAMLPNETDQNLMRALGISFADGVFHWREYRYDRLTDAVAYARRDERFE